MAPNSAPPPVSSVTTLQVTAGAGFRGLSSVTSVPLLRIGIRLKAAVALVCNGVTDVERPSHPLRVGRLRVPPENPYSKLVPDRNAAVALHFRQIRFPGPSL
jgi:hypothetical protein